MTDAAATTSFSRRKLLAMGGGAVASGVLLSGGGLTLARDAAAAPAAPAGTVGSPPLSAAQRQEIQAIIQVEGTYSNNVLNIQVDRDDVPDVTKDGVPIKPSFEINGNLCFQALPDGMVMLNGDFSFKPEELNPAIHQMVEHGLVWQAMHQHLFGMQPMMWFEHFRGIGTAVKLAEACAAFIGVTSTPLPQTLPKNPTTPLDVKRLEAILGGPGTVGSDGVVSFQFPPQQPIRLGGVYINSYLNIYSPIDFEPLGGSEAAVVPDFGQLASQPDRLVSLMQAQGWEADCLYNQETDEDPQLYFSHYFKVGDAYELARQVRRGLEVSVSPPA